MTPRKSPDDATATSTPGNGGNKGTQGTAKTPSFSLWRSTPAKLGTPINRSAVTAASVTAAEKENGSIYMSVDVDIQAPESAIAGSEREELAAVSDLSDVEEDVVTAEQQSKPRAPPSSSSKRSARRLSKHVTPAKPSPRPMDPPEALDKEEQAENADADANANTDHDDNEHDDEEEYTFKAFIGHRWTEDSIEIEVEWDQGENTWEPEYNLQTDAPDALFAYWKDQGGRPENPYDPEMYEIFAVRKHSRDRKKLLVEWVGYGPKEATWLSSTAVEETAADVVAAYWEGVAESKTSKTSKKKKGKGTKK